MRVVVTFPEAELRDYLRQVVLSLGLECEAADCVDYSALPTRLAAGAVDLVVLALDADAVAGLQVIQQTVTRTQAPVLAVGPTDDPQLILQTIRVGAREYLDETNLRNDLTEALSKLDRAGEVSYRRALTLAVAAAQPGTGVTTVATNLAFALAEKHPHHVALAELGSGVAELALNLDIQPRHGVAELAQSWDRLDATMMRRALVAHPGGVHVLACPPETLDAEPIAKEPLQHMILLLKGMFDYLVLDLGRVDQNESSLEALRLADVIVLIVRLDVPSLRLTRKLVQRLVENGVSTDKLRLVANRYGQRRQIRWKEAEQSLGLPLTGQIPDDPATLNEAINRGQPLIATSRRAGITRSFTKLASQVNGRPPSS